jgi:hypothetical protein
MPHPTDRALICLQVPDIPVLLDIPDHLFGLRKRVVHGLVAGWSEGIDRSFPFRIVSHKSKLEVLQLILDLK